MVKVEKIINDYAEHSVAGNYFVDEGDLNHPYNDDTAISHLYNALERFNSNIKWYEYIVQINGYTMVTVAKFLKKLFEREDYPIKIIIFNDNDVDPYTFESMANKLKFEYNDYKFKCIATNINATDVSEIANKIKCELEQEMIQMFLTQNKHIHLNQHI